MTGAVHTVHYTLWRPFRQAIRYEAPRPYLDVVLHSPTDEASEVIVLALVDSGTSTALFTDVYARWLGITLEAGQRGTTHGIGGAGG